MIKGNKLIKNPVRTEYSPEDVAAHFKVFLQAYAGTPEHILFQNTEDNFLNLLEDAVSEFLQMMSTSSFSSISDDKFLNTTGKLIRILLGYLAEHSKTTVAHVVNRLSALFARKNRDYGPMNIALTGEAGLVVRLIDKFARIDNLLTLSLDPLNESLEDSVSDAINYLVILSLVRKDLWAATVNHLGLVNKSTEKYDELSNTSSQSMEEVVGFTSVVLSGLTRGTVPPRKITDWVKEHGVSCVRRKGGRVTTILPIEELSAFRDAVLTMPTTSFTNIKPAFDEERAKTVTPVIMYRVF